VRVDDGCRQDCEVNNETSGYNRMEDLFRVYWSDEKENRMTRRYTLCTDDRKCGPNDEGKYSLSFGLCRTNELIKDLPLEFRKHIQPSSLL
jgi:hypothetical protein